MINELIDYNSETGVFTFKAKRKGRKIGQCGWRRPDGYLCITINYKCYLAHRLAWFLVYGEWPLHEVDHINGDPSDNRICNLRLATHSQNLKNQKIRKNNTSGYKGVYFNKKNGNWIARIKINYRYFHIGVFADPESAHLAYVKRAQQEFGEFHREIS